MAKMELLEECYISGDDDESWRLWILNLQVFYELFFSLYYNQWLVVSVEVGFSGNTGYAVQRR